MRKGLFFVGIFYVGRSSSRFYRHKKPVRSVWMGYGNRFDHRRQRGVKSVKKWRDKWRRLTTGVLDFPQDITMEMPRITMIGQLQMYIENHRGVLAFTQQELRLLLTKGQLLVRGQKLVIRAILPEEVLLEGIVDQVIFLDE
jgi:sporulation protein YqfC